MLVTILLALGKWALILLTLWGALRAVIWLVTDRGHGLHDFWQDFFNPFHNSIETFFWVGIPVMAILTIATYHELPVAIQDAILGLI